MNNFGNVRSALAQKNDHEAAMAITLDQSIDSAVYCCGYMGVNFIEHLGWRYYVELMNPDARMLSHAERVKHSVFLSCWSDDQSHAEYYAQKYDCSDEIEWAMQAYNYIVSEFEATRRDCAMFVAHMVYIMATNNIAQVRLCLPERQCLVFKNKSVELTKKGPPWVGLQSQLTATQLSDLLSEIVVSNKGKWAKIRK